MTGEWLGERIREIREDVTTGDEGSLWILFFDDPEATPVMAHAIAGAADERDTSWLPGLARILEDVAAGAYLVAVIRADGRPRPADDRLWRDLQTLLRGSRCRVLAFLVVGATSYWCAPGGEAPAAA